MKTHTNRLLYFCFSVLLVCLFPNCMEDDEQMVILTGDLTVTVRDQFGTTLRDATVYTAPTSQQGTTDQFGSVLLREIPAGSYEVFAEQADAGVGKTTINIRPDELINATVIIDRDNPVQGRAPSVSFVNPLSGTGFSPGESVTFSVDVTDDLTPPIDLTVNWESDLDGSLGESPVGATGNATFTTDQLSPGTHRITASVTDADNFTGVGSVTIDTDRPEAVTLLRADKTADGIELVWDEYTGANFKEYRVYRGDENCSDAERVALAVISEVSTINFIDALAPFVFQVCYYIEVVTTSDESSRSNVLTVNDPAGQVFDFTPFDVVLHPENSWIYLLDQGGSRLLLYDYEQEEFLGNAQLEGTPGYIDIADNGDGLEVYVPSSDGWIYAYDATTLETKTPINVGIPVACVVSRGDGTVVASVQPSPWWEQPVRTYNRATGIHIDGNGGFDRDRLRLVPDGNRLISISTGVSPIDMEYFEIDEGGTILTHVDDQYHGDHPLDPRKFRIDPTGTYSITSAEGAVYTTSQAMEYRGSLQRGALRYSDFAFSPDGSIIYAGTQNRNSVQIGGYPSLIRSDEILTRGFPFFIERAEDRLIIVSKTSESAITTGIEIVAVDN